MGRLTRDPELKHATSGGLPYAILRIAVNKQVPDADGTVRKTVSVIDVVVWRHQAEIAAQLLRKGSTCMCVGSLQQEDWSDAEGRKHSRLKVIADRVQFLDRRIDAPTAIADADASTEVRP